jgi:hypothetical protein
VAVTIIALGRCGEAMFSAVQATGVSSSRSITQSSNQAIINQQSAISNQQSAISNQQSAIKQESVFITEEQGRTIKCTE